MSATPPKAAKITKVTSRHYTIRVAVMNQLVFPNLRSNLPVDLNLVSKMVKIFTYPWQTF